MRREEERRAREEQEAADAEQAALRAKLKRAAKRAAISAIVKKGKKGKKKGAQKGTKGGTKDTHAHGPSRARGSRRKRRGTAKQATQHAFFANAKQKEAHDKCLESIAKNIENIALMTSRASQAQNTQESTTGGDMDDAKINPEPELAVGWAISTWSMSWRWKWTSTKWLILMRPRRQSTFAAL